MRLTRRLALAAFFALAVVLLLWELALAPATPLPRTFWAALKIVPLLIPLYGLIRGTARAHMLAGLIALYYFSEGVALAYVMARSGSAAQLLCVSAEALCALGVIVAGSFYARFSANRAPAPAPE